MGAKANTASTLQSVVEQYMAAVKDGRRSVAENLLARLHVGYPQQIDRDGPDQRSSSPGSFDWFGYFRERGFVLSETAVLDRTHFWAVVEAKCTIDAGSSREPTQTVVFRMFREKASWLISDISLILDADVRRDEAF